MVSPLVTPVLHSCNSLSGPEYFDFVLHKGEQLHLFTLVTAYCLAPLSVHEIKTKTSCSPRPCRYVLKTYCMVLMHGLVHNAYKICHRLGITSR